MSTSTGILTTSATSRPDVSARDIVALLEATVSSAEPAVVFSSIASLCAPQLCLQASIAIAEADARTYLISYPIEPVHSPARTDSVAAAAFGGIKVNPDIVFTDIHGDATESYTAFDGVLAMRFAHPAPTQALLGQLIVAHATALVQTERLSHTAQIHRTRADNLELGWRTNREIGMAMGILMKLHNLTEQQAFDLLRRISQRSQRKIRDIALDVVTTGAIEAPSRALS